MHYLETQKHKENTEYKCNNCGNYYKQDSSLYRHKRNCTIQKSDNSERPIDDITNIITTVVETNNQFQTKMIEENKNMMGNFVEKFVILVCYLRALFYNQSHCRNVILCGWNVVVML